MSSKVRSAALLLLLLLACLFVQSCGGQRVPIADDAPDPNQPAGQILIAIANYAVYAAAVGLFACIVLAWFGRHKLAITIAGISASSIALAAVVGWVGAWWEWLVIGIVCLVFAAGALWAWARRAWAEPFVGIDLDGDGFIAGPYRGPKHPKQVCP